MSTLYPGEPVRWGALGCSRHACTRVIPALQGSSRATVVAIGSRTLSTARAWSATLGIPRAYGSYLEVLTDPHVQAVYIALPNHLHAEWTIQAAKHGKHVLCEKPAAMAAGEGEDMVSACAAAGVRFFEGFMYRFHPQQRLVKQLLAEGAIGIPRLVRTIFSFRLEPRHSPTKLDARAGGGALLDLGCYCVDVSRWVMEAEPKEVVAWGDRPALTEVERSVSGILDFGQDRRAVFDVSFMLSRHHAYEVIGTEGRLEVPEAFVPEAKTRLIHESLAGGRRVEMIAAVNQFREEFESISASLRDGAADLPLSARDALANARVITALRRSLDERRSVQV